MNINERDIYAKTATGKEYVSTADRDGFVSYAEGLKYVNTTDKSLIVKLVTQHKRHDKINLLNTRLCNTSPCYITKFAL